MATLWSDHRWSIAMELALGMTEKLFAFVCIAFGVELSPSCSIHLISLFTFTFSSNIMCAAAASNSRHYFTAKLFVVEFVCRWNVSNSMSARLRSNRSESGYLPKWSALDDFTIGMCRCSQHGKETNRPRRNPFARTHCDRRQRRQQQSRTAASASNSVTKHRLPAAH